MTSLELAANMAKEYEGLSLEPYYDPIYLPTIGFGHLLSRTAKEDLSKFPPLESEQEAFEILMADMTYAMMSVRRLIKVELSSEQEAALCDFAFNCGSGNLQVSTLRRVINRGEFDEAPKQFRRWVYARGIKLKGLIRRREAEVELWGS